MIIYLAIATGGAIGAVSRYAAMRWISSLAINTTHFPWSTLAVNILGSLLIGVLYVMITEKMLLSAEWRSVLIVGFLGAFTTFSTFSLDALLLLEQGWWGQAVLYILSSIIVCMLAAWFGMALIRILA